LYICLAVCVVQQLAFADKVLLNKTDLVGEDEKQAVRARIHHINGAAEIIGGCALPYAGA
jgi:G3E family GTPase